MAVMQVVGARPEPSSDNPNLITDYRGCFHKKTREIILSKTTGNNKTIINSCIVCQPLFESVGFKVGANN